MEQEVGRLEQEVKRLREVIESVMVNLVRNEEVLKAL